MIRAVFFDAGNTLLHAVPSVMDVYARETERFGAAVSVEEFANVFRPVFREFVREYARREHTSDELDRGMWREILTRIRGSIPALSVVDFEPWFEHLYAHFGKPESWRLYDDVAPTLRELRSRGYRLGIISNWDRRLRRIAEDLGLTAMIDALIVSSEAGVRKPHPRIFEAALAALEVRPEEAVHVGDVPEEDIDGAVRAGIRPVLMRRDPRIVEAGASAAPEIRFLGELIGRIP